MSTLDAPTQHRVFMASARDGASRRSPVLLAGAAILCGLGLMASGVTLVRAADEAGVFEVIRNDYVQRMVQSVRLKEKAAPAQPRIQTSFLVEPPTLAGPRARAPEVYASEGPAPRKPVARKARVAMSTLGQTIAARRTVCVRTCDGYIFPLGNLGRPGDLPSHSAACAAACPGADTALYMLPPGGRTDSLAFARSAANGAPYRRLPAAFLFRKERVAACSCQGTDNIARRLPILLDPTLRAGDVVVDTKGAAKVYAGNGRVPHSPRAFADFRTSPALGRQAQAQVDRVMGVSQRQARARAYGRSLAVREAAARPARGFEPVKRVREAYLREITAPAGSAANVRVYSVTMDGARLHGSGARIIEVR